MEEESQEFEWMFNQEDRSTMWKIFVDDTVNKEACDIGVKVSTLKGAIIEQSLFIDFSASNNEVEYKAVIVGSRLAKALQVSILTMFTNFKLVSYQINSHMITNNEQMIAYKAVVLELLKNF